METLYYSRTRLVLGFILAATITLGAGYLLFHREITEHLHGRAALFGGSLGHFVTQPIVFFFSLFFTYRLAVTAADAKAVEATPTHLVISGFFRRRELVWSEVGAAAIEARRTRNSVHHELVIYRVSRGDPAGEMRVSLESMTLDPARWDEYVHGLMATAEQRRGWRKPPSPAQTAGDLAKDAVEARYPAGSNPIAAPPPRGFGRKGL